MRFLITGANRGIGRAVAEQLLSEGAEVVAAVRQPADMPEVLASNPALVAVPLDLTDRRSPATAVQAALATGSLDGIVCNAGVSTLAAVEDQIDGDFERVMATNFDGHRLLLRAALPHLRKRRAGRIVFVSSLSGLFGLPGEAAYCASKFATEALAQCLRFEVERLGIHVSVVSPGYTHTELAGNSDLDLSTEANSPYRALMEYLLTAQKQGEQEGDAAEIVAASIVHALMAETPKARYLPGSAEALAEIWRESSEADFFDVIRHTLDLESAPLPQ